MAAIEIVVPASAPRRWQAVLIDRLVAAGHAVSVARRHERHPWPDAMRLALSLERRALGRRGPSLAEATEIPGRAGPAPALRFDLTGAAPADEVPTLLLLFDGRVGDSAAVAALAAGRLPEIAAATTTGRLAGRAAPMVDRRSSVALGIEDVLARAVTLAVSIAARPDLDGLPPAEEMAPGHPGFLGAYLGKAVPRLAREALRRSRFRSEHWRVGYRFSDGPGVADTGRLGSGWSVLPDDTTHFYADPFAFLHEGRHYVFVEDYPHATKKAAISLVVLEPGRPPGRPEVVLEEAHHLSYPQVVAAEGNIFMLPEASASNRLTLYRAARFPDRWEPEAVLIEGAAISDATLVALDGRFFLLATDREGGFGSTSDTLVVYFADRLTGPWHAHPRNPVLIDRRRARPGGALIRREGALILPIQDGTLGYGGGLGLSRIEALNTTEVRLAEPVPISAHGDFPYPMIHTLNRAGRLEVIDGIAAVPKPQQPSSSRS